MSYFSFAHAFASRRLSAGLLIMALCACSPTWNWREVSSTDAPYTVLLPAKPTSYTRPLDLNGLQVDMSMTAAEVSEVNFAVASAKITDAGQRQAALTNMQAAMLRNIGSEQHSEKLVMLKGGASATEIVAQGQAGRNKTPVMLYARFAIHGEYVIQAIALGPKAQLAPEIAETFLTSFTLH